MYPEKSISLTESQQHLIDVWRRIAHSWGLTPTMAQIFALLYVYPEPLDTDALVETLGISRDKVSSDLRKLMELSLVHEDIYTDTSSSRRYLYTAECDPRLIAANVAGERFTWAITPTNELLQELLQRDDVKADAGTIRALQQLQEAFEAVSQIGPLGLEVIATDDWDVLRDTLNYWTERFGRFDEDDEDDEDDENE